jgi:DNA-binding CsgD family transcriptional regulator
MIGEASSPPMGMVKNHLTAAYRKLKLEGRAELEERLARLERLE